MRDLVGFREAVEQYRKQVGQTEEELARELYINVSLKRHAPEWCANRRMAFQTPRDPILGMASESSLAMLWQPDVFSRKPLARSRQEWE